MAPKIISFIQWCLARPAEVFLATAAIFGTVLCFSLPPLNGSDEFTHFPRAYGIYDGQLTPHRFGPNQYGDFLPTPIVQMVDAYRDLSQKTTTQEYREQTQALNKHFWAERNHKNSQARTVFSSSAPYSPWAFTTAATGIALADLLGEPLLNYVYISRLCTLLVWIVLTYLAIRIAPGAKWFFVAIALLPTSMVQAVTIGPDALVNGASWLLIAMVMAIFARTLQPDRAVLTGLFALSFILATTKQGYWLLAALPFLIPIKKSLKQTRLVWRKVMPAILGAVILLYLLSARPFLQDGNLLQRTAFTDSGAQFQAILQNPSHYLAALFTQPFTNAYDAVYAGIVGIVGNRFIWLPLLIIGLIYAALAISLIAVSPLARLRAHRRLLIFATIGVIVGTYILTSTALYLSFTPVGSTVIEGMQGRYFLPLLPLAAIFALTAKRQAVRLPHHLKAAATVMLVIALLYTCVLVTT